jgi:hypothetical protein
MALDCKKCEPATSMPWSCMQDCGKPSRSCRI